jgi:VanZ family protein
MMAIIYFIMGIVFVFMATRSAGDTVWNTITILLAVVATFDFIVGFRLMSSHFSEKKKK